MKASENTHQIRGQTWNCFESGSGHPILFLHNGGGALQNWAHQLEHFSFTHRVIAPDLPGFGRSHRPNEPLTLDTYVSGLSELLNKLNCPNPILVGNCIGSAIALEFALNNPEKVRALALFNICGGIPMLNPRLQFWAGLRPRTGFGKAIHKFMIDAARHPNFQSLNESLIYANGEPKLHPMLEQFVLQQRHDPHLRASLYWLVMGLESFNVFSQPRQRPINFPPTMLGWGKENNTLAPKWASMIAEWLKPDKLLLLEDAGHMPMYEKPEAVNEELDMFINSLPNA